MTSREVHVPGEAAWTELPIPEHVIMRFEEMAEDEEEQPVMNSKVQVSPLLMMMRTNITTKSNQAHSDK